MHRSQQHRYDYRTRIQVPLNSSDAVLLDYLKSDYRQVTSQKEMQLSALRAYWLPIAYEALRERGGSVSDEELARMAQNCILHLRERAEMLRQLFCPKLVVRSESPKQTNSLPKAENPALLQQPSNQGDLLHRNSYQNGDTHHFRQ
jgi:hypothetical protein